MEEEKRGKIKGFRGSWGSGLAYLLIEDSATGVLESVPCDNGPLVRALESCFGNVITGCHCVNQEAIFDKEIIWNYDDFGLTLGYFRPVDEEEYVEN